MMTQAASSSARTATQVEMASKRIEAISNSLKGFASSAMGVLGTFGIAGSLMGAFKSFEEFEKNTIRLRIAIESNGRSATDVIPAYTKWASEIEKVTTASKGEIMSLIKTAEAQGLQDNKAKSAAQSAIALAGAIGGEANEYMRAMVGLQQGNLHLLRRISIFKGIRDESQLVAKVQSYINQGWKAEQEIAQTAGGQLEKLGRSFKQLNKEVGGLVAEAILPAIRLIASIVDWFKQLDPQVRKTTVYIIAAIGAVLALGPALSALRFALSPVTSVLGVLVNTLGLLVTPVGVITVALAAVGYAFVKFTDTGGAALDYVSGGFDDLKEHVGEALEGIKSAIEAGDIPLAWNILWKQLELGWVKFRNTIITGWVGMFFELVQLETKGIGWLVEKQIKAQQTIGEWIIKWKVLTKEWTQDYADQVRKALGEDIQVDLERNTARLNEALRREQETFRNFQQDINTELKDLLKQRNELITQAITATPVTKRDPFAPPNVEGWRKARHEVEKFNAALFGSAEAATRIAEYQDRLERGKPTGGTAGTGIQVAAATDKVGEKTDKVNETAKEGFRKVVDELAKNRETFERERAKAQSQIQIIEAGLL